MKVTATRLPEVLLIEPKVFGDVRGFFFESFAETRYREAGIGEAFVQDNLSHSRQRTLRGLHLQHPHGQGKLVSALEGEVYDVAVDVRTGSPRFGVWVGEVLSADNKRQLYVPPGFAHGFCVLSDTALFHYKCTDYYHPETELTIAWNDAALAIDWPIDDPIVSEKDLRGTPLNDVPPQRLPAFSE